MRLFVRKDHLVSRRNKVPFIMAMGNGERTSVFPNTCAREQQE